MQNAHSNSFKYKNFKNQKADRGQFLTIDLLILYTVKLIEFFN